MGKTYGTCGGRREIYAEFALRKLKMTPLSRPRYRLEDNIKIDVQEIRWAGVDWIRLAEDRE